MQPSEVTATIPGYPPHGEVLRILGEAATGLSARTGRKFLLGLDVGGDVGVLRAVRDDGYHATYAVPPVGPSYQRTEGERIGGEDLSPEERARLWFRLFVDAAVEAFVAGHNQEAA